MQMEELLEGYFRQLAAVDSPSGQEQGLSRLMTDLLAARGFAVASDQAGNILARRGDSEPLLLCCHLDTVESTAGLVVERKGEWLKSSGQSILGADDKAGLAVLLAVLERQKEGPAVEVLLTAGEERGMVGSRSLKPGQLHSRRGFVLDAGEPAGTVINRAPGEAAVTVVIQGKGAHAAVEPQRGVDAIRLTGRFLSRLPRPRPEKGWSFNFGLVRGGEATNTICSRVELKGEIRGYRQRQRELVARRLKLLLARSLRGSKGRWQFFYNELYPGYHISLRHPLFNCLRAAARPLGLRMRPTSRFAGSDANILNDLGIATVNLGVGVARPHTNQERVSLADMALLARWLESLLARYPHGCY